MAQQFAEFEEIGDAPGFFQGLVEFLAFAEDVDVFPEFLADGGDLLQGFREAARRCGPCRICPT